MLLDTRVVVGGGCRVERGEKWRRIVSGLCPQRKRISAEKKSPTNQLIFSFHFSP
jgi:hypothetical protein